MDNFRSPKVVKLEQEIQALKRFADDILDISFNGGDVCGYDIQGIAEKHGLLKSTRVFSRCGDDCLCADVTGFPVNCLRKTYQGDKQ